MTQQEQDLLDGLIKRVNGTALSSKDADAERLLQGAFGSNPNALYILCQTVLVQQLAMDNAQRQLVEARAELDRLKQAPEQHGSFLGNLFGLGKGDATQQPAPAGGPGYAPVANAGPGYGNQPQPGYEYGQPTRYGQPTGYGQAVPPYGAAPVGGGLFGGGGGFLQGAAQTAAGVVAGEFAFRALEDVFRGFGGGGEGRGFGGGTDSVNNYYGSESNAGESGDFGTRLRDADGLSGDISPDVEDRRGESQGFFGGGDTSQDAFDAANSDGTADGSGFGDDSSSGFDDSYTDGGGDDGNNF